MEKKVVKLAFVKKENKERQESDRLKILQECINLIKKLEPGIAGEQEYTMLVGITYSALSNYLRSVDNKLFNNEKE